MSDAHVGSDLIKGDGRPSLAEAIEQSEGPSGFDWDVAVNLGDLSGNQGSPDDEEGQEVVRQYGALKKHRREQDPMTWSEITMHPGHQSRSNGGSRSGSIPPTIALSSQA